MTRADPAGIVILDAAAIEASTGYPPRAAVEVLADGSRRPVTIAVIGQFGRLLRRRQS